MLRRMTGGLSLVLAFSVGGSMLAAEPKPGVEPGVAAFCRWHAGPPPAAAKPAKPKKSDAEKAAASDTAAARKAQEEANLIRRIGVCDRIKQVAMETGDEKLERQAEALEQKASQVYQLRASSLGKSDKKTERGEKP